ncbi:MAG: DUF4974 domain-containing protein [Bacteroidaceae bacterium]|nr:DUF4974 domain-containing protein [Bacteroidaceae bacterium]
MKKADDIDRRIGMPDIDAEWAKFEREMIDRAGTRRGSFSRIAAAVALVLGLSLTALASVYYVRVVRPTRQVPASPAVAHVDSLTTDTLPADSVAEFFFDNVDMLTIARTLGEHYGVEPVFKNEKVKTVRLYAHIGKEKSIDEVVELLNHFKKVKLSVSGGKLIIE